MATELGNTGLGALIDVLIEVGLDDAFFILKIMCLKMCLLLLVINLFLIPNCS